MKKLLILFLALVVLTSTASAATLNVGSTSKYKTIQSAVNAAKNGDTIKVAYGTYKENVCIDKQLSILGTKYPKVNGFYYSGGGGTINGFSIQKYGVSSSYAGGGLIRNNYFYNCGIALSGATSSSTIMNNQIKGGTIYLYDTQGITITGNTISNSKYGLYLNEVMEFPTVTKNTFKNCGTAVYIFSYGDAKIERLTTFSGNKYLSNKVNIQIVKG